MLGTQESSFSFCSLATAFFFLVFPGGSEGKESACNAGDPSLIRGSERSSGEGNGNPLQYLCLENSMVRGAWWAVIYGVPKGSDTTEQLTLTVAGHCYLNSLTALCLGLFIWTSGSQLGLFCPSWGPHGNDWRQLFGCHQQGKDGRAPDISWVEVREVAKHPL